MHKRVAFKCKNVRRSVSHTIIIQPLIHTFSRIYLAGDNQARKKHELLQLSDCTAQAVYTMVTDAVDVGFSPLVVVSVVEPRRQGITFG